MGSHSPSRLLAGSLFLSLALAGAVGLAAPEKGISGGESAATDSGAELTIKAVMRLTMTKGLSQKVIKGKASEDEQRELVKLFIAMAELPPPKGSSESWKSLNADLVRFATEVSEGKPSHKALAKAANCAQCHNEHRPK